MVFTSGADTTGRECGLRKSCDWDGATDLSFQPLGLELRL
jgi:hypothetical protein